METFGKHLVYYLSYFFMFTDIPSIIWPAQTLRDHLQIVVGSAKDLQVMQLAHVGRDAFKV